MALAHLFGGFEDAIALAEVNHVFAHVGRAGLASLALGALKALFVHVPEHDRAAERAELSRENCA